MNLGRSPSGIASEAGDLRGQPRVGEGISDERELFRLVEMLRNAERQSGRNREEIMIGEFTVRGSRVPSEFLSIFPRLSRSEVAVMRFIGWSRSNADIATLLDVSEATVRTHMTNAIAKLGVDGMRGLTTLSGLLFFPSND